MKRIRSLLVDDHAVVREGLVTLLTREPRFEVAGEAGTGEEAVEKALLLHPDVVVMDIRLPGLSGIEACRAIRAALPQTAVIMLTSYSSQEAILASIMAGAAGYVLKEIGSRELFTAIERVAKGESLLDATATTQLLDGLRHQGSGEAGWALLPREERILELIAAGRTNREIAQSLFLSEKTIRNYVSLLLDKLGLHNRAEAAAYAVRRRIGAE